MKKLNLLFKKNWKTILKTLFIIFVVGFVIVGGIAEFKSIDFLSTAKLLRGFSITSIIFFILFGIFSVSLMSLYDYYIVKYLGMEIDIPTLVTVTFISNSVNNISGLGGLTGATIRSLIFKKNANNENDILNYNLLLLPATGVGLSVMTILMLFKYDTIAPFLQEYKWMYLAIIVFILYLFVYFFIDRIFNSIRKDDIILIDKRRVKVKLEIVLASFIEWIFAYIMFYLLARHFNSDIGFLSVMAIFSLGSIAGIISLLPGGVGSFDLVVLLGLQSLGMNSEHILASLILFRTFYDIIPLIFGIIGSLLIQIKTDTKIFNFNKLKTFMNKTSGFTNGLLSILIYLSGLLLLVSGLIPNASYKIKLIAKVMPVSLLQISNHLSICIGILLIFISKEIRMRVKRSYKFTIGLLIFGILFLMLKSLAYIESLFLLIALILLIMSKNSFYRKSIPGDWFKTIIYLFLSFIGILIYMKISHIILKDFMELDAFKDILNPGSFTVLIKTLSAYLLLVIFIVYYQFSEEKIFDDERYETLDEDRLASFLEDYQGNFLTNLIYLNDKHLFWSSDDKVLFQYEISHNLAIILGDPIGSKENLHSALKEFKSFIDEYGYKSVFYQASNNLMSFYHDNGYYMFKLGETGLVDLEEFDLSSPKSRDFRNNLKRFAKDGYEFIFYPSSTIDRNMYIELKSISDEWLGDRSEMGFSLGYFDINYLNHSDIGIIRDIETNEIITFGSVSPSYDNSQSVSIDLMRYKKEIPSNAMTYLLLNLILHYQRSGYKIFNLGMAPLSNVGTEKNAHRQERIAHLVYKYGNHFYSFDGLKKYKNKFSPNWSGKYLVYEDISLLPSALIEATYLIHKKHNN